MTFTERRLFPRRSAIKGGRIVFNRASSTINCTMRNYSDGGALLDVASILGVPKAFDLRLEGHPSRSCTVIWKRADALGIAFSAF